MALVGTVTVATLLPCQGTSAQIFHALGLVAIATLFFLQGARLSREAILAGMTNWKLHAAIAGTTFVLFPAPGVRAHHSGAACAGPVRWCWACCSSARCRPPCSRPSR